MEIINSEELQSTSMVDEVLPGSGLPRAKQSNPYNYTEVQLAKRKRDIKAMKRDFPSVNDGWIEMLYDVIENMPPAEVENIINNKLWEKPSKFKAEGGVIKGACELLNEDFTPISQPVITEN